MRSSVHAQLIRVPRQVRVGERKRRLPRSASCGVRMAAAEVERDGEEQQTGPPVNGIERQGLLIPDVVTDQPDDEPDHGHALI